jgi:hypothetical protein
MAKAQKAIQKIWAVKGLEQELVQPGSAKAGQPVFSKDVDVLQDNPAFESGYKDVLMTRIVQWDNTTQIFKGENKTDVTFNKGDKLMNTTSEVIYKSKKDGNIDHPLTDEEWWEIDNDLQRSAENIAVEVPNVPNMEEENAYRFIDTNNLAYTQQTGIGFYNEKIEYQKNGRCTDPNSGRLKVSLQEENINHPLTDEEWWADDFQRNINDLGVIITLYIPQGITPPTIKQYQNGTTAYLLDGQNITRQQAPFYFKFWNISPDQINLQNMNGRGLVGTGQNYPNGRIGGIADKPIPLACIEPHRHNMVADATFTGKDERRIDNLFAVSSGDFANWGQRVKLTEPAGGGQPFNIEDPFMAMPFYIIVW